jgi:hypothetical protein
MAFATNILFIYIIITKYNSGRVVIDYIVSYSFICFLFYLVALLKNISHIGLLRLKIMTRPIYKNIYVAATNQHIGKTTSTLGSLGSIYQQRSERRLLQTRW